jgi:hypothetical protein
MLRSSSRSYIYPLPKRFCWSFGNLHLPSLTNSYIIRSHPSLNFSQSPLRTISTSSTRQKAESTHLLQSHIRTIIRGHSDSALHIAIWITIKMCLATVYSSPSCSHQWMSLTQPCGNGMNFMTCQYRDPMQTFFAPSRCCPYCDERREDPCVSQMLGPSWGGFQSMQSGCCCAGTSERESYCDYGCCRKKRKYRSYSYKERPGNACMVM